MDISQLSMWHVQFSYIVDVVNRVHWVFVSGSFIIIVLINDVSSFAMEGHLIDMFADERRNDLRDDVCPTNHWTALNIFHPRWQYFVLIELLNFSISSKACKMINMHNTVDIWNTLYAKVHVQYPMDKSALQTKYAETFVLVINR